MIFFIWPIGLKNNKNIYIVIREFNMTKRTLLPKGSVGDAENAITLFVKKGENIK